MTTVADSKFTDTDILEFLALFSSFMLRFWRKLVRQFYTGKEKIAAKFSAFLPNFPESFH